MKKQAITSAADIEEFFNAYNSHDWETVFNYISTDCLWDAFEKCLKGRQNVIDYWTNYHAAFKETLGRPEKVVFGEHAVYLQVKIHLEFLMDGLFFGKSYKKGETLDFACADFYELDDAGKIKAGYIFIKFFNP
jgi:hypothetical protein